MAKKQEGSVNPFDIINDELNGRSATQSMKSPSFETHTPTPPQETASASAPSASQISPPSAAQPVPNPETEPTVSDSEDTQSKVDMPVKSGDGTDVQKESGGCISYIAKGMLIVALALVLAWIIFMPSGSFFELKDHVANSISQYITGTGRPQDFTHSATAVTVPSTTVTESTTTTKETETVTTAATTAAVTTTTAAATTKAAATTAETTTTTAAEVDHPTFSTEQGYIYVYLKSQVVVAYNSNGEVRKAFTCSSGKASTPTKTGDYSIRAKYRWRLMIGNCYTQYASSFSSGYLFHSIPYNRRNAGTMSDASYDKLGTPASSGCIRLCFRDSKWIYDNCPIGTSVRVIDDEAPDGIVTVPIIPRNTDTVYSGWDPTDTAANSPYNQ